MSKPTPLSPWFAVLHLDEDPVAEEYIPEWYIDGEVGEPTFTNDVTQARLFNSIHSATRVARAVGGYAVVVIDEEALKEFRPKGL